MCCFTPLLIAKYALQRITVSHHREHRHQQQTTHATGITVARHCHAAPLLSLSLCRRFIYDVRHVAGFDAGDITAAMLLSCFTDDIRLPPMLLLLLDAAFAAAMPPLFATLMMLMLLPI